MVTCNCTLPYTQGPDICIDCSNRHRDSRIDHVWSDSCRQCGDTVKPCRCSLINEIERLSNLNEKLRELMNG